MNKRDERQARSLLAKLEKERDLLNSLYAANRQLQDELWAVNDARAGRIITLRSTIQSLKDLLPEPDAQTEPRVPSPIGKHYEPGPDPDDYIKLGRSFRP